MSSTTRFLIIGGGIAGCALLYRLAEAGCSDAVLLERSELTSGSTWHAAGNLPLFMGGRLHEHAPALVRLHRDSLECYAALAERTRREIGLHRCGSLKLATRDAEIASQDSFKAYAAAEGIRFEVLDAEDALARFPYLDVDGVRSVAWTPDDGHVDPSTLTNTLAEEAVALGCTIRRRSAVRAIERHPAGGWRVSTDDEEFVAGDLVNAAGLHAREVSRLIGHRVPVVPMERQYLITDELPGIESLPAELPVLRDASAPLYARQEGQSLLLGLYDKAPEFWAIDETPADFDQSLLQPDLERVDEALQNALRRLPVLNSVGVKTVINGPLLRTPDACPLVGPAPGFDRYWLNTGYFAGIAQAGGCTGVLARWLLDGGPGRDVSGIDPSRFDADVDVQVTMDMTRRSYAEELGQTVLDGTRI